MRLPSFFIFDCNLPFGTSRSFLFAMSAQPPEELSKAQQYWDLESAARVEV
jgi:hypothetical protein